ncbi:MAG: helix-turn-helix transcriptional regulator [Dermabacter sp.]|nr:helix-turn-helix transcriptional regulator [Dermabacter sp.]
MTPATLATLREALGLTHEDVARLADVDPRTVRRWQSPQREATVPNDVSEALWGLMEWVTDTVDAAVEGVEAMIEQQGHEPEVIDLTRYVDAASAARAGIEVPHPVHTAAVAQIARELHAAGLEVAVHYFPVEP